MKVVNDKITIDFTVSELQLIENAICSVVDNLNERIEKSRYKLKCDKIDPQFGTRCLNNMISGHNRYVQLMKDIGVAIGTTYDESFCELYDTVE